MASRVQAGEEGGTPGAGEVTRILNAVNAGDARALERLLSVVYDELRGLATAQMSRERGDHTLQPTALVNEAYLRLVRDATFHWENRAHFFGAAAEAMRRILVDHARAHEAAKRGGGRERIPLSHDLAWSGDQPNTVMAVDGALDRLAAIDGQMAQVVKLRFFAGLNVDETADVLGTSSRTVIRLWRSAKAWLYREMLTESEPDSQA